MKRARSPSPEPPEAKRAHLDTPCPDLLPELWDIIVGLLPVLEKIVCLTVNREMRQRAIHAIGEQLMALQHNNHERVTLLAEWHSSLYRVDIGDCDAGTIHRGFIGVHLNRIERIGTEWRWRGGYPSDRGFFSFPCPYRRCYTCWIVLRPLARCFRDDDTFRCKACMEGMCQPWRWRDCQ